ncbi:sulfatase-like hydrolase/transferase [Halorubrum ezzemoulense]|uniref:sulfatase-like hydrolase/transferase n=1 Tax=Halorubrum ezzemoulense TaxID=337243 RepID=UPI00232AD2A5|nr:sulfatase-like hydrolase/transferase [Halorubrum ezzemoulense]MDB2226201.1 sulfatase-like hydrolase/transferase [Halorubrum ezzemoulense]
MTRNIALFILDTVRKDYFDDYAWRTKRKSGTSFSQCRAASSWSVPSHASIFSGELPHQHNIHSESFDGSFDFHSKLRNQTFLDDLESYDTFGVSSNIYINEDFGFGKLFNQFRDHSIGDHYSAVPFPEASIDLTSNHGNLLEKYLKGTKKALSSRYPLKNLLNGMWLSFGDKLENIPLPRVGDKGAKANADSILQFISDTSEPYFVFANFMDAHNPLQNSVVYDQSLHSVQNSWSSNEYDKWELLIEGCDDDDYIQNYRELYGTSIDYLDQVIHDLSNDILSQSDNETTIIVTADHGHNLGYDMENGYFHHTASLSEGVLHVPLEIINPPPEWPAEVTNKFSQVHIPQLVELIKNGEWDEKVLENESVVAERIGLLGENSEIDYPNSNEIDEEFWNRMIRCGYDKSIKYEWDSLDNSKKYELDIEQACWQSLCSKEPVIPDRILALFDEEINEYKSKWGNQKQDLSFDPDTAQDLKDLGYL